MVLSELSQKGYFSTQKRNQRITKSVMNLCYENGIVSHILVDIKGQSIHMVRLYYIT